MLRRLLLTAVFCGAATAAATPTDPLRICVQYQTAIPAVAKDALALELKLLFQGRKLEVRRKSCVRWADAVLTVRDERSLLPPDVLGLAIRNGDRISPNLEVFLKPVAAVTGDPGWDALGRALARVAAHELLHYLTQRPDHDADGLFDDRLTPDYLTSEQVRPTLIASLF